MSETTEATTTGGVEVQAQDDGTVGVITLNRVSTLNALTTDMIAQLDTVFDEWAERGLSAVVLRSTSPKAFCAGGDIRWVQENSLAGDAASSEEFFSTEYRLNEKIASYPTPIVSLIDGICMGGGWGLSVHGTFRVVTSNAVLSMPETGIGFFPDIGASYFLPRLPGELGTFLGLTGYRMNGHDALYTGVATHFVDHAVLDEIPSTLAERRLDPVRFVLNDIAAHSRPEPSPLQSRRTDIDDAFGASTVDEIFDRLKAQGTDWADGVIATLERMSRQSLDITLALLRYGRTRTLRECLDTELALTRSVIREADFIEGIRAALVDKDRNPSWTSSRFAGLDEHGGARWIN